MNPKRLYNQNPSGSVSRSSRSGPGFCKVTFNGLSSSFWDSVSIGTPSGCVSASTLQPLPQPHPSHSWGNPNNTLLQHSCAYIIGPWKTCNISQIRSTRVRTATTLTFLCENNKDTDRISRKSQPASQYLTGSCIPQEDDNLPLPRRSTCDWRWLG